GARGPRLGEPRVLDARVVGHEIEEHPDLAFVGGGDQRVDVGECPEDGLHAGVVGDVVAPVGVGRDGDRVDPDAVDVEPGEVVETVDDPAQIADAITVRVGIGTGGDLVEDAFLPPPVRVVGHGPRAYAGRGMDPPSAGFFPT